MRDRPILLCFILKENILIAVTKKYILFIENKEIIK